MRKILLNLVIPVSILAIFFKVVTLPYSAGTKFLYFSPCDNPVGYRIDAVDPKFGLSKDGFTQDVALAAGEWNKAMGRNLFTFDPKGKLSINLIYDERQSLNTQIMNLQNQVQNQESFLKPSAAQYEKKSADFNAKLADLNRQIDYWNSQGGAPKEEYEKLIKLQDELKAEASRLNKIAQALNQSAQLFNANVNQLNQTINTFNEEIAVKPEEGIYDPNTNKIEVYFNVSRNELVHTLEHELGHSLGLEHIQNKKAIMYAYTNEQTILTPDDINALKTVCQYQSYFDLYKQRLNFVINQIQKNLNPR